MRNCVPELARRAKGQDGARGEGGGSAGVEVGGAKGLGCFQVSQK